MSHKGSLTLNIKSIRWRLDIELYSIPLRKKERWESLLYILLVIVIITEIKKIFVYFLFISVFCLQRWREFIGFFFFFVQTGLVLNEF